MSSIFYILAIYAVSYIIRNLSGPFNIFDLVRNQIVSNKYIGVFFYNLLSCPWCIGFYCGCFVYLLSFSIFNVSGMLVWALAGSAVVAFLDIVYDNLINSQEP